MRKHADLWIVVLFCPDAASFPAWDEWSEYPTKAGGDSRVLLPKSGVGRVEVDARHVGAYNFGLSASGESGEPMILVADCINFGRPGDEIVGRMSITVSPDDDERGFGVAKLCMPSLLRHMHNEVARLPAPWPVRKARKEWL